MGTVLCLALLAGLTLTRVLLMEIPDKDSCYRNFAGSWMNCHGTLPNFANESFAQLAKVEQVDVVQCHFNDVPKRAFQGLIHLKTFLINCNNSVAPLTFAEDALEGLDQLYLLTLNQNNIKQLPPSFLCRARSLRHVFLWTNSLTSVEDLGLHPQCNSSVSPSNCGRAIETMVVSRNFIERLPDFMMCTLRSLKRLDLSQNRISRIDQHAFAHLDSLLELDLSENNITLLPEEVGRRLKKLLILNLGHNPRLENVTSTLRYMDRLQRLDLTNAGVAVRDGMKDRSFRFRTRLIILILDQNGLAEINETVFEQDPQVALEQSCHGLILVSFFLTLTDPTLPLSAVAQNIAFGDNGITRLRYVSLDSNDFEEIPSALNVLPQLQKLSLRRNRITALDDDQFQALSQLHILFLSYNNIRNISGAVFSGLRCLLQLHLDHNAIGTLDVTAFDNNVGLLELFLQGNRISSIRGMFRHNRALERLDLSHNLLTVVGIDWLPLSLGFLNLSHNHLVDISPSEGAFPVQLGLSSLDLSHNRLEFVDKDALPISVVFLNLNDNRISSLGNCAFCAMGRMLQLHLENNRLRTVKPEWLKVNARKGSPETYVFLRGNDFVCDCTLKVLSNAVARMQMGNTIIIDLGILVCRPEFNKGHGQTVGLWSTRPSVDFLCRSNHSTNATLPDRCNVFHDLAWDMVIGDCTDANLTSVPDVMPRNVMTLYLDGNHLGRVARSDFSRTPHVRQLFLNNSRIWAIEDRAFEPLSGLEVLHLEHNLLHVIGGQTFVGLPGLVELYLQSNRLEEVDQEAFQPLAALQLLHIQENRLTTFPVWELASLEHLAHVRLSENPWSCECDYLQNYREWLQKSVSKVQDVKTLFCNYGDNSTSATPLIAYDGANCYAGLNFLDSKYFPLTTCLSALALFLFVASAIVFTYREEIRVIVYYRYGLRLFSKSSEPDNDQNKIYDAFVCYSHDDEEFFSQQLMPGLEDVEPPYRLCVHSRDFVIGSFITDNILEAVEKSRRTILILSEHFIQSEWCRFEFKTAHLQMFRDPSHRVILIVRGGVPKNLHPEMKVYLKTNTYLMWDDRLFWKRLYYAMPDRVARTS